MNSRDQDAGELAGAVIGGRYEIAALLGRGGMASVYRASDLSLGREVALKIFGLAGADRDSLKRESSEIRLLASLSHHALVTLFDASVDTGSDEGAGHAFLVMELVDGPTLAERIARGPLRESDVAHLVVDLAEAMHVVHDRGIVHRDIKPANILLSASASPDREFRAKLSDFGIAYLTDSTRLTTPGTIIGTAAYLSPEQARGAAPGAPADVYSLGLVALEALTGVRAFEGSLVESLAARLVSDPLIPASLGGEWGALLTRMTAREPEDRPTALEVAESARRIERELHAAGPADAALADATQPLDEDAPDPTRELPPQSPEQTEILQPRTPTATASAVATEAFPAAASAQADATEPFPAPTRVMPAAAGSASDADETAVLTPAGPPGSDAKPAPRRSRTRALLVAAVVLVALVAGGIAWGVSTASAPDQDETVQPEPLPENAGTLGDNLDELLESVTP